MSKIGLTRESYGRTIASLKMFFEGKDTVKDYIHEKDVKNALINTKAKVINVYFKSVVRKFTKIIKKK